MLLTEFSNLQNLTKHPGKLNGTASKGTLMLIFSTAVLQNNLQKEDATNSEPEELPRCLYLYRTAVSFTRI